MSEVVDILKTVHEIFVSGAETPITVDARNLGMAYAIPKNAEPTVVEAYGPWHNAEIKQVFYEESAVVASVLAEVQLIMSWRFSEAKQYIIEANLDKNILSLDPTVSLSIAVRFNQPTLYNSELEAYEIPFVVTVEFRPVGARKTARYEGVVRADGTGTFTPA